MKGVERLEHKGFSYEFTKHEVAYLLFKRKKCPKCGGKLDKRKEYETLYGSELNSKADPIFISNAKIKRYQYIFICINCGCQHTLNELAK